MPRLSRIIGEARPTPLTSESSIKPISCPVAADTLERYCIASGSWFANSVLTSCAALLYDFINSVLVIMPLPPSANAFNVTSALLPLAIAMPSKAFLMPSIGAASFASSNMPAPIAVVAPTIAVAPNAAALPMPPTIPPRLPANPCILLSAPSTPRLKSLSSSDRTPNKLATCVPAGIRFDYR